MEEGGRKTSPPPLLPPWAVCWPPRTVSFVNLLPIGPLEILFVQRWWRVGQKVFVQERHVDGGLKNRLVTEGYGTLDRAFARDCAQQSQLQFARSTTWRFTCTSTVFLRLSLFQVACTVMVLLWGVLRTVSYYYRVVNKKQKTRKWVNKKKETITDFVSDVGTSPRCVSMALSWIACLVYLSEIWQRFFFFVRIASYLYRGSFHKPFPLEISSFTQFLLPDS